MQLLQKNRRDRPPAARTFCERGKLGTARLSCVFLLRLRALLSFLFGSGMLAYPILKLTLGNPFGHARTPPYVPQHPGTLRGQGDTTSARGRTSMTLHCRTRSKTAGGTGLYEKATKHDLRGTHIIQSRLSGCQSKTCRTAQSAPLRKIPRPPGFVPFWERSFNALDNRTGGDGLLPQLLYTVRIACGCFRHDAPPAPAADGPSRSRSSHAGSLQESRVLLDWKVRRSGTAPTTRSTIPQPPAVVQMPDQECDKMSIRTYPDQVLRVKSEPLREVNGADLARANCMLDLMYEANGVGLAGPQVGWNVRIVVMDVEQSHCGDRIFINPRILSTEGDVIEDEGCLSVPGVWAPVRRAQRVVVAAYNVRGERVEQTAEGLTARAWQHELDHLNGVLFFDRLEPMALMAVRHQLKSLERDAEHTDKG